MAYLVVEVDGDSAHLVFEDVFETRDSALAALKSLASSDPAALADRDVRVVDLDSASPVILVEPAAVEAPTFEQEPEPAEPAPAVVAEPLGVQPTDDFPVEEPQEAFAEQEADTPSVEGDDLANALERAAAQMVAEGIPEPEPVGVPDEEAEPLEEPDLSEPDALVDEGEVPEASEPESIEEAQVTEAPEPQPVEEVQAPEAPEPEPVEPPQVEAGLEAPAVPEPPHEEPPAAPAADVAEEASPTRSWPWQVLREEPEPDTAQEEEPEAAVATEPADEAPVAEPPHEPPPAYAPGEIDIDSYTCDDCVYEATCPQKGDKAPATCGSFQWKAT
ncbi:MAG: hypothetical protein Kow0056_02960 [Coriobacteriia bacterium]